MARRKTSPAQLPAAALRDAGRATPRDFKKLSDSIETLQLTFGTFPVDWDFTNALKNKGITQDELHRIVAPPRTLARRKEQGATLSPEESDRALRLERVLDQANRVFGSTEKAQRWLRKPCRGLKGAVPMDLLVSETGAHLVEEELHAIDFGVYA